MLIPKAHHTLRYLQVPTWIPCPPDNPAHPWSPLLAICSELLLLETLLHTWFVGVASPRISTQAGSACPAPAAGMEPLTPLAHASPSSSCSCGHVVFLPQGLWGEFPLAPGAAATAWSSALPVPGSDFRSWPQIHTCWLPSTWHLVLAAHRWDPGRLHRELQRDEIRQDCGGQV